METDGIKRAMANAVIREAERQGISHMQLSSMCGTRTDVFEQVWRDRVIGSTRFLRACEALDMELQAINSEGENVLW
jgi:hypothetical protein